ncbi:hypothetical protein RJ55_03736 [Drechmeria coniospora]|nr:hypothetical protein RJ55_03736 [Drechmeria coniospora]
MLGTICSDLIVNLTAPPTVSADELVPVSSPGVQGVVPSLPSTVCRGFVGTGSEACPEWCEPIGAGTEAGRLDVSDAARLPSPQSRLVRAPRGPTIEWKSAVEEGHGIPPIGRLAIQHPAPARTMEAKRQQTPLADDTSARQRASTGMCVANKCVSPLARRTAPRAPYPVLISYTEMSSSEMVCPFYPATQH